jgi:hypothetical protein
MRRESPVISQLLFIHHRNPDRNFAVFFEARFSLPVNGPMLYRRLTLYRIRPRLRTSVRQWQSRWPLCDQSLN